jgi:hypothetical protein
MEEENKEDQENPSDKRSSSDYINPILDDAP